MLRLQPRDAFLPPLILNVRFFLSGYSVSLTYDGKYLAIGGKMFLKLVIACALGFSLGFVVLSIKGQ